MYHLIKDNSSQNFGYYFVNDSTRACSKLSTSSPAEAIQAKTDTYSINSPIYEAITTGKAKNFDLVLLQSFDSIPTTNSHPEYFI